MRENRLSATDNIKESLQVRRLEIKEKRESGFKDRFSNSAGRAMKLLLSAEGQALVR